MKIIHVTILFLVLSNSCYSQIDYSKQWIKFNSEGDSVIDITKKVINGKDLSYLLESTYPGYREEKPVTSLYGLLGENFEKIEFVFTEIIKNENKVSHYILKGKTKVKDKITNFTGNIIFEKAKAYIPNFKTSQAKVVLTGSYKLTEDSNEKTAGIYIGKIKMILFTENIYADDILYDMDVEYENGAVRGFVGVRKTNENNILQNCLWGFQRFPHQYAENFDIGDGEEVINLKYAKPWFNYSEEKWNSIVNGEDEDFYLHTTDKDKGIHTSNEEYIKPEDATWYKLKPMDLEKKVIEQLKLNPDIIAREFMSQKKMPNNTKETIIVISEMVKEEEDYFELETYILIVNNETGKIIHKYFDHPNLTSDAIILSKIEIDTAPFIVSESNRAFGIRVHYHSMSQPNPYSNTTLSLFVKSKNTLKEVLRSYDVMDYKAEWNLRCDGQSIGQEKILIMMTDKTNGYYDILVKNEITESESFEDEGGECNVTEKLSTQKTVLKFNGETYK